ncbi:MAG: outer membrane protein transport protein [Deltaproteobacteria bacterium]|nr:outer membrane protein transport protein [Deltaproteobacteria bacterium]
MRVKTLVACSLSLTLLTVGARVEAGGLFLPFHGARGLGRAGAMVAGADDPGGIWYNPATIAAVKGRQILLDATLTLHQMSYARTDSGGNTLPEVESEPILLPIPTLALTIPLTRDFSLGASFSAGAGVLSGYPRPSYGVCDPTGPLRCVDTAHQDAPQRYTLVNLDGTLFLRFDMAVAWRVLSNVVVAVSLQNHMAQLRHVKVISSYNGTLSGGPEDPDFDSLVDARMSDWFNPSLSVGVLYSVLNDRLKFAATLQLPAVFEAEATLHAQLPVSPIYAASSVEGVRADVALHFPLSVAAGIEWRIHPWLRVEGDVVWEQWSSLDAITFDPVDITILQLPGVGDYRIPPSKEPLGYQDSVSFRLGAEAQVSRYVLRAGYGFELGATPLASTSVLSQDFNKHLLSVGASVEVGRWRMDAAYGVLFTAEREVDYRESDVPQVNPVNPEGAATVGGGRYSQSHHMLALGVSVRY